MKLRRVLISNDDGISSPFLNRFLEAFAEVADEVLAVVPAQEQSWIGRAFSRHKTLTLSPQNSPLKNAKIFALDGTPCDCVNIALGHLCEGEMPDAVVSGINIGQNLGLPLLWSSGTFSAAAEGAGWGIASFAASLQLANEYYEICRLSHQMPPEKLDKILAAACRHCADFVREKVKQGNFRIGNAININYPSEYAEGAEFVKCEPASVKLLPFYKRNPDGKFSFKYAIDSGVSRGGLPTDIECLAQNKACYSEICVRP
ncbi:MAG: 5'/3'-nucleotidase SurE [Opitutales bacterium]|nr:5'/3'-nucleotidase SurE [Opitutales bacterium]